MLKDRLIVLFERPGQVKPDERTVLMFFHGLGDTAAGWGDMVPQFAQACPSVDKIVVPTAPTLSVTVNGGAPCTAWFDIAVRSFNPLELMQVVQKRPPHVDKSIVDVLYLINKEFELMRGSSATCLNLIFGGFSQGAHMAFALGSQLDAIAAKSLVKSNISVVCKGIMMLSGVVFGLDELKRSITKDTIEKVPILQCHGSMDQVIPAMGGLMCSNALKQLGWKQHDFQEFPGMGHSTCPEEMTMIIDFLRKTTEASSARPSKDGLADDSYLCVPNNSKHYPVGQRVTITGLKSKPEMNDTCGIVESFDQIKGRYSVIFEKLETLSLQGTNLTAECGCLGTPDEICGQFLKISGLKGETSRPWNGALCEVVEYDADKDRYLVDLGCASQLKLKKDNLVP